jgi:hypothetical protein
MVQKGIAMNVHVDRQRFVVGMLACVALAVCLLAVGLLSSSAASAESAVPGSGAFPASERFNTAPEPAIAPAPLDTPCEANVVCVYEGTGFTHKLSFNMICSASGPGLQGADYFGIRNRCGNKILGQDQWDHGGMRGPRPGKFERRPLQRNLYRGGIRLLLLMPGAWPTTGPGTRSR